MIMTILTLCLVGVLFVAPSEQATYKDAEYFPALQASLPLLETFALEYKLANSNKSGNLPQNLRPEDVENSYKFFAQRPIDYNQKYFLLRVYKDALVETFGEFTNPKGDLARTSRDESNLQKLVREYTDKINRLRPGSEELISGTALSALIETLSCRQNVAAVKLTLRLIDRAVEQLEEIENKLWRKLKKGDATIEAMSELMFASRVLAIPAVKAVRIASDASAKTVRGIFPDSDNDAQFARSFIQSYDGYMQVSWRSVNCRSPVWL